MNILKHNLYAALLGLVAAPALAGNAYTWTDSAGVTHFSESAPPASAQGAEQVELRPAPVIPGPPPARYRSINDQAAQLKADREKRELARAKRRAAEASRTARAGDTYNEPDGRSDSYFYTPYPYWYPPYPPHYRHPHPRHRHHPQRNDWVGAGRTLTQKRNAEALRDRHWRW